MPRTHRRPSTAVGAVGGGSTPPSPRATGTVKRSSKASEVSSTEFTFVSSSVDEATARPSVDGDIISTKPPSSDVGIQVDLMGAGEAVPDGRPQSSPRHDNALLDSLRAQLAAGKCSDCGKPLAL